MSDITLTVFNLKKSEANAIVKAMNKLVELGQIEETNWVMGDEQADEVDSNLMREAKKMSKVSPPLFGKTNPNNTLPSMRDRK